MDLPSSASRFGSLLAVVAIVFTLSAPAVAQDAHYWTQQYGSRESLLGGAVIGSVDGLPSVYYNPARLGTGDAGSFALSTHVFGWETLRIEDGSSDGIDLSSTRSGLEPSLIAGKLPWGGDGSRWAYSLITRRRVDSDVGTLATAQQFDPDPLTAAASLRLENRVRDYWGGVTWSTFLGSRFALGVSGFGAYMTADRRSEVLLQTLDSGGGISLVDEGGYEFSHLRVLAKLGVWYGIGDLDVGATFTTPSMGIWGSSDIARNAAVAGAGAIDRLDVALREGLDAEYKSPLSIGFGAAWRIGPTRIHASCEWFDGLDPYLVAQSAPIGAPDRLVPLEVVHAADSVLDWGVGVEHRISDTLEGFASFMTNESSATRERTDVGTAGWSMDVVTAGTRMDLPWLKLTLGLGYAFGDTPLDELADLTQVEDGPTDAVSDDLTLRYRAWRVIFGFEF